MKEEIYVSIDVETNGPIPGRNSMLSLGAAAFDSEGSHFSDWTCNFEELVNSHPDPQTMEWWDKQPAGIYDETRELRIEPYAAMADFDKWVQSLAENEERIIPIGWPIAFDFMWVNWYGWAMLEKYVLGYGTGIDIRSYLQGVARARGHLEISESRTWEIFGKPDLSACGELRPHVALDDAISQGALYFHLRRAALGTPSFVANKETVNKAK